MISALRMLPAASSWSREIDRTRYDTVGGWNLKKRFQLALPFKIGPEVRYVVLSDFYRAVSTILIRARPIHWIATLGNMLQMECILDYRLDVLWFGWRGWVK